MLAFSLLREITTSGFVADLNPNATPPAETQVLKPQGSIAAQGSDRVSRSIGLYCRAGTGTGAEVPAATVTATIWQRDMGGSKNASGSGAIRDQWVIVGSFTTQVSSTLTKIAALGDTWIQVTTIATGGTATKVQLWGGELTTP